MYKKYCLDSQSTLRPNGHYTCPDPFVLLVSFTLANDIGSFIQCAPKFGDSG